MAAIEFTYRNNELDFGSHCLSGDFTLQLSTDDDGFSFRLIDVESCGKGLSKAAFALVQEWVDDDTAPRARGSKHKSLVRQAYEDELIERRSYRSSDHAAWQRQFLPAAE